MAFARRGYVYRQYLTNSRGGVNLPDTTWRRWLQQGKITRAQLVELGIEPYKRRRLPRRRVQPNRQGGPGRALSPQPGNGNNEDEVRETATPEENIPTAGEPSTSAATPLDSSSLELASDVSAMQSDDLGLESDAYISLLSSFSEDDSNLNDNDSDQLSEANELMASVLESRNIGVDKMNEPLVPSLQVTKFETLLMILHLAMRHGYTDVFLEDMMAFVNELVGCDAIPKTKFLFHKLFMFASCPVIHFFCLSCNIYLGISSAFKKTVVCGKCKTSNPTSSLNGGNYFISLSIRNQIKDVLCRPHIKLVKREDRPNGVIGDLLDGLLYQSLMKDGENLNNPNALTISFNCDGSPVFKSGPNSLWPIQFIINEIIPEQRFATENTLVAGLWFSRNKPSMEIFLQPFVDEMKDLMSNGVVWQKPDNSLCESPIFAISCCVDSVAKPQVQNIMQFNGGYGCGYCLHPNNSITTIEQLDRRSGFCLRNEDGDSDSDENVNETVYRHKKLLRYTAGGNYPLRTDKQMRKHMIQAQNTGQVPYGVKGKSVLCSLKYFSIVDGFPVDYMHAILLGVTKRLANLWFDSTSSGKEYYIGRKIDDVDKRLKSISPPSKVRYVRPISDRVHWKANEWRGFLLYFGLPALLNILPRVYLNHFKKLVSTLYVLSKDTMTYDDVDSAHRALQDFVDEYQDLYGEGNMVYNVHLCSHLARSVSKLGPLWANSAFPFESGNGRLVKFAKGTRGVATQLARKYMMMFSVPKLMRYEYKARDSVIDFCSNIIGYRYLKNSTSCNGVELLGIESYHELTNEQSAAFINRNVSIIPKFVPVFNRAIKSGTIYSGRLTSKQVKHDDSCVRLKSSAFARIELILKLDIEGVARAWCICRTINIAADPSHFMSPHIKQCSLEPFGSVQLIPFDDVEKKCLLISCGGEKYVAEFPNLYEKD